VAPYYESDIIYDDKNKADENQFSDFKERFDSLTKLFKPENIMCFNCSGYYTEKGKYKNSFHFRIINEGYYSCGNDIPFPKNNTAINGKDELFDTSVYKPEGKNQKMRIPIYTSKKEDLQNGGRYALPVKINNNKLEFYEISDDILLSSLPSNISEKNFRTAENSVSMFKDSLKLEKRKKVKRRLKQNNEVEKSTNNLLIGNISSLCVECNWNHIVLKNIFDLIQNSADDYEDWRNVIFTLRNIIESDKCFNQMSHMFSEKSSKYDYENVENFLTNVEYDNEGFNIEYILNLIKEYKNTDVYRYLVLKNKQKKNTNTEWTIENHDEKDAYSIITHLHDTTFSDIGELIKYLKENLYNCLVYIHNPTVWILKKNRTEKIIRKKCVHSYVSYLEQDEEGQYEKKSIPLDTFLLSSTVFTTLPIYFSYDFLADSKEKGIYDLWTGFKAKETEIDYTKLDKILHHLREIWCDGDENVYRYLISWFSNIFNNPGEKTGVAIALYSRAHGAGKGIIINWLLKNVFGHHITNELAGLSSIVKDFNASLSRRVLISIDELDKEGQIQKSSFNKMKHYITEPRTMIELKGLDPHSENIPVNFICALNHKNGIYIENETDRRWFMLELDDKYVGNREYFDTLFNHCNQEGGDMFFTYCKNYNEVVPLQPIPLTEYKKQAISKSISKIACFVKEIQDGSISYSELFFGKIPRKNCVSGQMLFNYFNQTYSHNNNFKNRYVKKTFLEELTNHFELTKVDRQYCFEMPDNFFRNNI
jgi:hypothetical protein